MGRLYSMIGRSLCTVRDSAAYQKICMTCKLPYPCICKLNAETLEEEAVAARQGAMARFGELVSQLRRPSSNLVGTGSS